MSEYKDNPEVNSAVNKIAEAFKNRQDLMLSSVKVDVKLETEFMDTIIGTIPGSRQFKVGVELDLVSCGDFSHWLANNQARQKEMNDKLRDMIIEYFASKFHGLSLK